MPDTSTPQDKAAEMLAVATSHPTWMVKRWLQRWGQQETMTLLAHNNRSTPPPPCPPRLPHTLLFLIVHAFGNTPYLSHGKELIEMFAESSVVTGYLLP